MASDIEKTLARGSIRLIRALLERRELSAAELVDWTVRRIERLDRGPQGLNAVRDLAPDCIEQARRADAMAQSGAPLPPLFGIPVLLKDNILAGPLMRTSAGAMALQGYVPDRQATLVKRLVRAGAIIVGKANMAEFADYVSDTMPAGFSAAGGMVINPLTAQGYERGQGSSVGSAAAVALGYVPLAIGTETQNSIQTPAAVSSVVGFKPTVGTISRQGIVPLVPSQDTAGPIVRTVSDAALVLDCLAGADIRDAATMARSPSLGAWRAGTSLAGARIGIPRQALADRPEFASLQPAFDAVLTKLAQHGAVLVDPCDIPTAAAMADLRSCVFRSEFHAALDAFLEDHGSPCGIGSLDELIAWNAVHDGAIPFGQSLLIAAAGAPGMETDTYRRDRAQDIALSRTSGIEATLAAHQVEALLLPMTAAAKFTGKAGAPVVAIPAGAGPEGRAFAVTVVANPGNDRRLIALAGAIEQIAGERLMPVER